MDQQTTDTLESLRARIARLEAVCGEAYQLAGAVGAPGRVLDQFAAAANGEPIPHGSILPVTADECTEVHERQLLIDDVRKVIR